MNNEKKPWIPVVIARIHSDFPEKFGIPRQSGLVDSLEATIVFEREYRDPSALRGIEDYTHIWLIWGFSCGFGAEWSPTVRPPRLGGNKRMGVFATRSPNRPNPVGLSCVRLLGIEKTTDNGTVLRVSGADLLDGTPIYDIKPYLPFTDRHDDATGGFAQEVYGYSLEVDFPEELLSLVPAEKREALCGVLSQDPRPSYIDDGKREYGMCFAGAEVRFTVSDGVLHVVNLKI